MTLGPITIGGKLTDIRSRAKPRAHKGFSRFRAGWPKGNKASSLNALQTRGMFRILCGLIPRPFIAYEHAPVSSSRSSSSAFNFPPWITRALHIPSKFSNLRDFHSQSFFFSRTKYFFCRRGMTRTSAESLDRLFYIIKKKSFRIATGNWKTIFLFQERVRNIYTNSSLKSIWKNKV